MNEFVKIRDDADKEVLKKLKKLLKKYKVKQDAVNEHIAAIIIENLNDEGLIILSPEMQFALQNSVSVEAPEYFNRYSVDGKQLFYVRYRKNAHITWYAFYEELEEVYSIVYLANNQHIGHLLEISL